MNQYSDRCVLLFHIILVKQRLLSMKNNNNCNENNFPSQSLAITNYLKEMFSMKNSKFPYSESSLLGADNKVDFYF